MGKRKPNGYIAVCQCGVTIGAVDLDRTDHKELGQILGRWIAGGYELKPQFADTWRVNISPCQCNNNQGED